MYNQTYYLLLPSVIIGKITFSFYLNCGINNDRIIIVIDNINSFTDNLFEVFMFEKIVYYVGNKSIEINGEAFSLGEFTTEILNFPRDEYDELRKLLDSALNNIYKYGYIKRNTSISTLSSAIFA